MNIQYVLFKTRDVCDTQVPVRHGTFGKLHHMSSDDAIRH